ncbi:YraN family protein [Psychrobacter celer]|uniref:YraN family protein n=1 Tax=Psychrobacter celer TaxID=306572 RepID=UPI002FE4DA13
MLCYDNSEMFSRYLALMTHHKPLRLSSPKQRQGSLFEQRACAFLQAQGLTLIAQNWQQPKIGELDLVMLEKGAAWSTLVFVEVRQRRQSGFGDALLSVTKSKQNKLIKAARYFLQQHPEYRDFDCRFDVIAYDTAGKHKLAEAHVSESPQWLIGAFMANAW